MRHCEFIWDPTDNVPHLAEHDVTPEEAAYVVEHAAADNRTTSRTTGNPIAFGYTRAGRFLAVVYWVIDPEARQVYIETAYDVPPPIRRNPTR